MKTNISGIFTLETKGNKVSKKNMVVNQGITQLFNWFKMADYVQKPNHKAGEKLFSDKAIERINWKNSEVSVGGLTTSETTNNEIKNSFSNVSAIVDSWENSSLTSNYSSSNERFIKVTFKDSEKNDTAIDLKGIALYGKRTSNYSSYYLSYCGKIVLKRKIDGTHIAKKTFEVPVMLTPCYISSEKLTTDKTSQYWMGGKYYVYLTFEELFNNQKDWKFFVLEEVIKEEIVNGNLIRYSETIETEIDKDKISDKLVGFQYSADLENPYLEKIYEVEISDRYNSYIQINELDVFSYRKNVFYNAPSFFKLGNGKNETSITDTDLSNSIDEIPVEEIYKTDDGKIRYVGYIQEDQLNNAEISEIGIFFEQDKEKKMFAKTVLTEPFIVPEGSFIRISYDLEVE
jgi:hypothetical protein